MKLITRAILTCQHCRVTGPHDLIPGERAQSTAGREHLALQCVSCRGDRKLNACELQDALSHGQMVQVQAVETIKIRIQAEASS